MLRHVTIFEILVGAFATYYLADVWGGRFETIGYGALCAFLVFLFTLVRLGQSLRSPGSQKKKSVLPIMATMHARPFIILVVLAFYANFQGIIGYGPATFAALVLALFDVPLSITMAAGAAGFAVVSHLLFLKIMKLPLPPLPPLLYSG